MKEGDVVLALLAQTDGQRKYRPAVVLRRMPGFGDLLVCGISTQLRQQVAGFDEILMRQRDRRQKRSREKAQKAPKF